MPESILATQSKGREWVIEGAGRAKYLFRLAQVSRIVPQPRPSDSQAARCHT